MRSFFHKKVFTPFSAVLLAVICMAGGALLGYAKGPALLPAEETRTLEQIYEEAVIDAVMAEEDELHPLVTLTEEDGMVSVQDGKFFLLTVNDTPELYPAGKAVMLAGEIWAFTDLEIAA